MGFLQGVSGLEAYSEATGEGEAINTPSPLLALSVGASVFRRLRGFAAA